MMITEIRYAFRQLTKEPSFSVTAIFALALGIGATTAMFALLFAFLLRPLPYRDAENLVMLQSRSVRSGNDLGVNYLDFQDWQKQTKSFADMAFFNLRWNGNVEIENGVTETLKTTFTTANLFSLLGIDPIVGRNLTRADDEANAPKVALISHRLWMRMFHGNRDAIGRQIRLDGGSRTVVGVMPPGFRFPSQTDVWVPMASVFGTSTSRSWRADQAIGRLNSGVTIERAQAEMTVVAERLSQQYPDSNKEVDASLIPLREHTTGGIRFSLLVLLVGCGSLLLIACANVSQLLLARAAARESELAVRAALGASRWQLAQLVLTECVLLALVGSALGVVLAFWLVDFVATSIPIELPFWIKVDLNPKVLFFTIALSFLTALVAGLLPALQVARVKHSLSPKSAGRAIGLGAWSREILTSTQAAISIVLLVGATLVLRSVLKLEQVDPGFDPHHVLIMEVNPTYDAAESASQRVDRFERLLGRLSLLPGVEAVAANNSPPFVPQRPWNRAQFTAEGQAPTSLSENPAANFQTVSLDYFRVLLIPLRSGRFFSERDKLDAPRVCIVSEKLAKSTWPGEKAVGKRLKIGRPSENPTEDWMTVVGVVGDVRHQALEKDAGPDLYQCSLQLAWKQMHFLVRTKSEWTGDPTGLAPSVRREIAAIAPEVGVFNFAGLDQEIANSLWQQRLRGWLLGFFSIVALSLAAAGLSGVVAYGVAQRTREIGIRITLGATRRSILGLVLGRGMRAIAVGLVIGVGCALALVRVINAALFGIESYDLVSYAVPCLLLTGAAFVASIIPARRATLVNPIEALRAE